MDKFLGKDKDDNGSRKRKRQGSGGSKKSRHTESKSAPDKRSDSSGGSGDERNNDEQGSPMREDSPPPQRPFWMVLEHIPNSIPTRRIMTAIRARYQEANIDSGQVPTETQRFSNGGLKIKFPSNEQLSVFNSAVQAPLEVTLNDDDDQASPRTEEFFFGFHPHQDSNIPSDNARLFLPVPSEVLALDGPQTTIHKAQKLLLERLEPLPAGTIFELKSLGGWAFVTVRGEAARTRLLTDGVKV